MLGGTGRRVVMTAGRGPAIPAGELLERHPAALEARRPDVRQRPPDGHDADRGELVGDARGTPAASSTSPAPRTRSRGPRRRPRASRSASSRRCRPTRRASASRSPLPSSSTLSGLLVAAVVDRLADARDELRGALADPRPQAEVVVVVLAARLRDAPCAARDRDDDQPLALAEPGRRRPLGEPRDPLDDLAARPRRPRTAGRPGASSRPGELHDASLRDRSSHSARCGASAPPAVRFDPASRAGLRVRTGRCGIRRSSSSEPGGGDHDAFAVLATTSASALDVGRAT